MENELQNNFNYQGDFPSEAAAGAVGAVFAGLFLVFLVVALALYVYMAISFMKIAKKTNTQGAWMAWVPILNLYLMVKIAQKPAWWFLLLFIPMINIIISVLLLAKISKALGKPEWLGLLFLVPVANIVLPGYLAFSENENQAQSTSNPAS